MSKIHINEEEFNWGGFLIPQIWCIGNGVPIGYLSYVPILAPFVAIYLGFNGSKLAYERQSWKYSNLDEFYKVQRRWTIAGIIIVLLTISFFAFLKKDNIYNLYNNRQQYKLIMENADKDKKIEESKEKEVLKIVQSDEFKQCLGDFTDYEEDRIVPITNSKVDYAEMYFKKSITKKSRIKLKYEKFNIEKFMLDTRKESDYKEYLEWSFYYKNNEIDYAKCDYNNLNNGDLDKDDYIIIDHDQIIKILEK